MGKCCTLHPSPRAQRRINGFQQPLNCQQVIGWIVIVITAIVNFAMLMQIQFEELKIIANVIYVVLYMSHVISHVMATVIDPSEEELRKLEINNVPEFDRSVHAHVIENGRCHLCNINTSSRSTKHCSLCNKCVDRFDHHCKWLNNCVGHRNYPHFIASVTTALMISLFTSCLCFAYIAIFFLNRQRLSPAVQKFIDCGGLENYCGSSISFLTFLIIYGGCASGIGVALFHLCCFHVYISVLGVSTYEYMMKGYSSSLWMNCCTGCRCGRISPLKVYKTKDSDSKNPKQGGSMNNQTVGNLIDIVIGEELVKKRKIFDKNKIHPEEIGDR